MEQRFATLNYFVWMVRRWVYTLQSESEVCACLMETSLIAGDGWRTVEMKGAGFLRQKIEETIPVEELSELKEAAWLFF